MFIAIQRKPTQNIHCSTLLPPPAPRYNRKPQDINTSLHFKIRLSSHTSPYLDFLLKVFLYECNTFFTSFNGLSSLPWKRVWKWLKTSYSISNFLKMIFFSRGWRNLLAVENRHPAPTSSLFSVPLVETWMCPSSFRAVISDMLRHSTQGFFFFLYIFL